MSEWVLNQSWGLPVLAAFLAVVLVFEARKAIKAYKEKKIRARPGAVLCDHCSSRIVRVAVLLKGLPL